MPSNAFQNFRYNVVDVDRLVETHSILDGGTVGKKGLGHITRSGIVMLCASWELYLEMTCSEAAQLLSKAYSSPDKLPKKVQQELAKMARDSKHELKPLEFAGDGWRELLTNNAVGLCNAINTPKAGPINELFSKAIGLDNLSDAWSCGKEAINDFVSVRGDIAHNGRHAEYIKIGKLIEYRSMIDATAVETDNIVANYLKEISIKPWNITT
jgi:RiboL-PSP-HEPN